MNLYPFQLALLVSDHLCKSEKSTGYTHGEDILGDALEGAKYWYKTKRQDQRVALFHCLTKAIPKSVRNLFCCEEISERIMQSLMEMSGEVICKSDGVKSRFGCEVLRRGEARISRITAMIDKTNACTCTGGWMSRRAKRQFDLMSMYNIFSTHFCNGPDDNALNGIFMERWESLEWEDRAIFSFFKLKAPVCCLFAAELT
jgi:hypothetical protein